MIWGFLLCLRNGIDYVEIPDSEFFAKRYDFGRNFWDREGRKTSYTQNCTV